MDVGVGVWNQYCLNFLIEIVNYNTNERGIRTVITVLQPSE